MELISLHVLLNIRCITALVTNYKLIRTCSYNENEEDEQQRTDVKTLKQDVPSSSRNLTPDNSHSQADDKVSYVKRNEYDFLKIEYDPDLCFYSFCNYNCLLYCRRYRETRSALVVQKRSTKHVVDQSLGDPLRSL